MLFLYWRKGKIILEQQQSQGWGTKVVDRLADDLRKAFPDMRRLFFTQPKIYEGFY